MTQSDITVRDNPAASRFEATVDGELAVAAYRREGDTLVFTHTEVPDGMEGRGVGSTLARGALDATRAAGLRVATECPFMTTFVRRHREYHDLLRGG